jgi:serralysin
MTETTTIAGTFFVGINGRAELFQFNIQNRAFIDAGDLDDKVSARDNGLFDLYVQGGTGRDILEFGPGADTIYGDNPGQGIDGEVVVNNPSRDRDAILGGGNNDTIFGQGGDDVVNAENGNDFVHGGLGNDFLMGGTGDDVVHGSLGNDRLFGGSAPQTLVPTLVLELLWNGRGNGPITPGPGGAPLPFIIASKAPDQPAVLTGTGVDELFGGDGNDLIAGQDGADLIDGGAGSDTAEYTTSSAAVKINLNAAVQVGGDAAGDRFVSVEGAWGSNFNDTLTGNALANILSGLGGWDVITPGGGIDSLNGGGGNDTFVYNTAPSAANRDVITDFSNVPGNNDIFHLDNAVMPGLGAAGQLAAAKFFVGTAAHDADDRIVYNKTTGVLSYDSNGNLGGGAVQLTILTTKPTLTFADFLVI